MTPIVLKNHANVDNTYNYVGIGPQNAVIFERQADTLIGRSRLTLKLAGNKNVNRIKAVLSVPSVCEPTVGCTTPAVAYTQVASLDVSAVVFSSEAERLDLIALFRSLVSSSTVGAMVVSGISPTN